MRRVDGSTMVALSCGEFWPLLFWSKTLLPETRSVLPPIQLTSHSCKAVFIILSRLEYHGLSTRKILNVVSEFAKETTLLLVRNESLTASTYVQNSPLENRVISLRYNGALTQKRNYISKRNCTSFRSGMKAQQPSTEELLLTHISALHHPLIIFQDRSSQLNLNDLFINPPSSSPAFTKTKHLLTP